MILVGSGALVWRAASHTVASSRPVDIVIHPREEEIPASAVGLDHIGTDDVNLLDDLIDEASTDGIICSTGNPFIFRAPVLELGLQIVNIHGAPLPGYRGLPLAAAAFALLRGEREFGVTLHRVDAGIDTGDTLDRRTFPLPDRITLEELSLRVSEECHAIFVDNLDRLDRAPQPAEDQDAVGGEYFGWRQLRGIAEYRDDPRFSRATDLGVLAEYYPEYAQLFADAAASRV